MPNDGLRRFYDNLHADEASARPERTCACRRFPTSGIEAIVHYLPRYFRGGHILELGAGDGTLARSLIASGLPFDLYTLTEFSEPRLAALRRSFADPRVRVAELDAEALPEGEMGKYDAVLMTAVIEHLLDPISAMRRIRLLLRPGGFAYVDTPNIAKYTRRLKLLFGRFPSTAAGNEGTSRHDGTPVSLLDDGHLHYFSFRSLTLTLTQLCGFSRVRWLPYHCGRNLVGRMAHHVLAHAWPSMFSDAAMVAWA